jgi:hypothetical protein
VNLVKRGIYRESRQFHDTNGAAVDPTGTFVHLMKPDGTWVDLTSTSPLTKQSVGGTAQTGLYGAAIDFSDAGTYPVGHYCLRIGGTVSSVVQGTVIDFYLSNYDWSDVMTRLGTPTTTSISADIGTRSSHSAMDVVTAIRDLATYGLSSIVGALNTIAGKTNLIPNQPAAVGSAMTIADNVANQIGSAVEAAIVNDGDATAVLQAIADKVMLALDNADSSDVIIALTDIHTDLETLATTVGTADWTTTQDLAGLATKQDVIINPALKDDERTHLMAIPTDTAKPSDLIVYPALATDEHDHLMSIPTDTAKASDLVVNPALTELQDAHLMAIPTNPAKASDVQVTVNTTQLALDLAPKMPAPVIESVTADVDSGLIAQAVVDATGQSLAGDVVEKMTELLVVKDTIRMGQGTGRVLFRDQILSNNKGLPNVVIRAFAFRPDETVDWTHLIARNETDKDGWYELNLDPGKYRLSIERGGEQVAGITITITDPA